MNKNSTRARCKVGTCIPNSLATINKTSIECNMNIYEEHYKHEILLGLALKILHSLKLSKLVNLKLVKKKTDWLENFFTI